MKSKWISLSLVFLLGIAFVHAQFEGGNGTAADPWQIAFPDQLDEVRNYTGSINSDKHFVLINDIDLDVAPYNTGDGWVPIGPPASQFTGSFDGNGYTISNLYIDRPGSWYVSLFGSIDTSGSVFNLHLDNVDITGYSQAAGLAGNNKGNISNCSVSGVITGQTSVGGIAGENNLGIIENCHSHGSIIALGNNGGGLVGRNRLTSTITGSYSTAEVTGSGNNSYGGLLGWNDSIVTDSYATGTVTGIIYCGGLVGRNYRGSISNSYATGNVYGSSNSIGGLAGGNGGLEAALIINCYALGNVQGDSSVGGLVGENRNHGIISNSYALGDAWGSNSSTFQFGVGGLLGELHIGATVEYSYSTGQVTGNPPMGGLIGHNRGGSISVSYWNTQTSNQNTSAGGMGLTTPQMVQQASFYTWDFTDVWQIMEGYSYPYLQENAQEPPPTPYGEPEIAVTPDSFDVTVEFGEILTEMMLIENTGDGPLVFELFIDFVPDRLRFFPEKSQREWLSFNPQNGNLPPGESIEIAVVFDTELLEPETIYFADIIVDNNAGEPVVVPVVLEVTMPYLSPPENLQIDTQSGLLTWEAPSGNELSGGEGESIRHCRSLIGYNIYLDGELIDDTEETFYQYEDLIIDQSYNAGVQAVYLYGKSETVTLEFVFEGLNAELPDSMLHTKLFGNYPNPFNPHTKIVFFLGKETNASIKIFDVRGRHVDTILDQYLKAGEHTVFWNGKRENGYSAASGVYFYRLETEGYSQTGKMLLLK